MVGETILHAKVSWLHTLAEHDPPAKLVPITVTVLPAHTSLGMTGYSESAGVPTTVMLPVANPASAVDIELSCTITSQSPVFTRKLGLIVATIVDGDTIKQEDAKMPQKRTAHSLVEVAVKNTKPDIVTMLERYATVGEMTTFGCAEDALGPPKTRIEFVGVVTECAWLIGFKN